MIKTNRKINARQLADELPGVEFTTEEKEDGETIITVIKGDEKALAALVDTHVAIDGEEYLKQKNAPAQANEIAELIKDSEIFKAEVQKGVREALKSEDVKQTIIGIFKEGTVK